MNGLEFSGWVNGYSMWPNLIPGDMLKTAYVDLSGLRPGMIIVFPWEKTGSFAVHRIRTIRSVPDGTILGTAGDYSGMDDFYLRAGEEQLFRIVTGVLRRGKYRKVTGFRAWPFAGPRLARLSLSLARRFLW